MEKEDLEAIREVVTAHDIFVITDEIYAELTYGKSMHLLRRCRICMSVVWY